MKKRLFSLALIIVMVLSSFTLFACNGETTTKLSTNATNYIAAVDTVGDITIDSETKLKEVSELYNLLDETDKATSEVKAAKATFDTKFTQFEGLTSSKFISLVGQIPALIDIRAKSSVESKIVAAENMYDVLTPGALIVSGVSAAQTTMVAARAKFNEVKEITLPMLSTSKLEIAASGVILIPTLQADIAGLKQFFAVSSGAELANKVNINLNVYFDSADQLFPENNILFSISVPTTLPGIFEIEPSTIITKLKEANVTNKEINSSKAYKFSVNYIPKDSAAYYASDFTSFTSGTKYVFHITGDKLNTNIITGFELANGNINYNEGEARNNILAIYPGNYNGCVVNMGFFEGAAAPESTPFYTMSLSIAEGAKPSMDQLTTLIARKEKASGSYKFAIKISSNNQTIAKDSDWSGFTASFNYVITADSAKDKIVINAVGMVFNITNGIEWGAANPTQNLKKLYGDNEDAIRGKVDYNVLVFANSSNLTDTPLFSFNIINYSGFFGVSAYGYDELVVEFGKACVEGKINAGKASYKLGFQAIDKTSTYRNSDIVGTLNITDLTITTEDAKPRVKFITVSQEITLAGNVAFGAFGMTNVLNTYGAKNVYELDGKVLLEMAIFKNGTGSAATTIMLPMNYTMPLQESIRHYLAVAAKSNSSITSGQYFVTLKMHDLTGEFADSVTVQTNAFNFVFTSADEIKKLPNPNNLTPSNGVQLVKTGTELESISLSEKYLTKFSSEYRTSIDSVEFRIYKEEIKNGNTSNVLVTSITKNVNPNDIEFTVPTRAEIIATMTQAGETITDDTFYCIKIVMVAKGEIYANSDEAASDKFTLATAPDIIITNTKTSFRPKDFTDGSLEIQIDTLKKNTEENVVYTIKEGSVSGVAINAEGVITITLASITQDTVFTVVASLGATEVKAEKAFRCFINDATDLYWLEQANIGKPENLDKWVYWNDAEKTEIVDAYIDNSDKLTFTWICGESPNFWSTQLFYKDSAIAKDKSKTVSMKINSTVAGKITVNGTVVDLVIGDNTVEGITNNQGDAATVVIEMGVGAGNAYLQSGTIIISELIITENIPSENAIRYGGEGDAVASPNEWRYWNNNGVTISKAEFAGDVLDIVWASSNVWYGVQLFYKDNAISVGTSFTVTMKVNSSVEGKITVNGKAFDLIVGDNDITVTKNQDNNATVAIQMGSDPNILVSGALKLSNITISAN